MSDDTFAGEPLDPYALKGEIKRLTRERDAQKETAEYLLKLEQEWIDYNNQLAEDWKKEHARAEAAERKVEKLREALSILTNSVSRNWGAFERGLREEIGNTNYRCTAEKLDAARAALAETETKNVD